MSWAVRDTHNLAKKDKKGKRNFKKKEKETLTVLPYMQMPWAVGNNHDLAKKDKKKKNSNGFTYMQKY